MTENTKSQLTLAATRIFTDDVDALLAFYERVTGVAAHRIHPLFGEIATASGTLAIASTQTVGLLGAGSAEAAANRSVCLDFLVDDVDADHARLAAIVAEFSAEVAPGSAAGLVNEPTTMPWGNRSLLLRDPDGNLINVFTPVTPEARARFGM